MKRFFYNCISLDSRLFLGIYGLSGKRVLDRLFFLITKLADGWCYLMLFMLYLVLRTGAALLFIPTLLAAFTIEFGLYYLVKKNVRRIRPFERFENIESLVIPPDEFSFPSGHTAGAAVFAELCGSIFPEYRPLLYSYTAIVGFSRVYNGVHYPGDIFAGAALGILSARISLWIF